MAAEKHFLHIHTLLSNFPPTNGVALSPHGQKRHVCVGA
jgi:hypothetical protein